MYASERDGCYYKCLCGDTIEHSYLISSSNGFIADCCKAKGWDKFEYGAVVITKHPDETYDDARGRSDAYDKWCKETDWDRYHRDGSYREARSAIFDEQVRKKV